MSKFDAIRQEIIAHEDNQTFTGRGIEPLFQASENARIAIVGQAPGRKAEDIRHGLE